MTSFASTSSTLSATPGPSSTDNEGPSTKDQSWALVLIPTWFGILILCYCALSAVYGAAKRRVELHRLRERQELELRRRGREWELYP